MHTALYRKRRPKTFANLVGQPHVVKTLENQLESGELSHAYLFCGTRGTGKTSTARIFARAVNCQATKGPKPCNVCEACQSILAERCIDVVEIDAASNNSVDNIRDLREELRYPPTQCLYKLYIVDEVHMLSASAFNALLKTLEEPPPHVIFILATTDPQKIPATILSRCQRYDFKRISSKDMTETMKGFLQEENTPYEDAALEQIVYQSDGAMRDALSLLDQCLTLDGNLTHENVLKLLGVVDRKVLFDFTDALVAYDSVKLLEIVDEAMRDGRDVAQFANDLVRHFRDVLVASQGAEMDYSVEIIDKLKHQGSRVSAQGLIGYIREFSETLRELRFAPHMRTAFEVCALRLCLPTLQEQQTKADVTSQVHSSALELEGLISRITKIERQLNDMGASAVQLDIGASTAQFVPQCSNESDEKSHSSIESETPIQEADVKPSSQPVTASVTGSKPSQNGETANTQSGANAITPQLLQEIKSNWKSMCNSFPPMLRSMLVRCTQEANGGTLEIVCDNDIDAVRLKDKGRPLMIREALTERFNLSNPPNLAFIVRDTYNKQVTPQPTNASKEPQAPTHQTPIHDLAEEAFSQPAEQPMQLDWDAYGQGAEADNSVPF